MSLAPDKLDAAVTEAVAAIRRRFPYIQATDTELRLAVLTGVDIASQAESQQAVAQLDVTVAELQQLLSGLGVETHEHRRNH